MGQSGIGWRYEWRISDRDFPLGIYQAEILSNDASARKITVEISQLFCLIVKAGIDFVPQSKIQRQAPRNFPIVLNETAVVIPKGSSVRTILCNLHVQRKAGQEFHKGIHRPREIRVHHSRYL